MVNLERAKVLDVVARLERDGRKTVREDLRGHGILASGIRFREKKFHADSFLSVNRVDRV